MTTNVSSAYKTSSSSLSHSSPNLELQVQLAMATEGLQSYGELTSAMTVTGSALKVGMGENMTMVQPRIGWFALACGVYATGAVCVLGALGHLLSLALLVRGYRAASVFEVLKALSVCDIAFLLVTLLVQVCSSSLPP